MGTESHLCASQVIESACSMPARFSLSAGERIAAPPHAASAWNHKLSSRQNWAISVSGSMTPAAVVPAVPTTRNGAQPSSRSWRTWRRRLSKSSFSRRSVLTRRAARRPIPLMCAILLNE